MKRALLVAVVLLIGSVMVLCESTFAEDQQESLRIYDIMACNVYVDFDVEYVPTKINREQHKFLISFAPYTKGIFVPDLIDKITAYGPDGYSVDFQVDQEFNAINKNGYIHDAKFGTYWYMVNLDTGFMKEGQYTIEVKCKDGKVLKKSRYQKNEPSDALVKVYLKNKQRIFDSHSPSKIHRLPKETPLKNIKVSWKSLKDLAGHDAYYIYRLSQGEKSSDFDTQNLVWWDNIFIQRFFGQKTAGLNRNEVVITSELKPNTGYVYFTEITDSNAMGETNICVFQPHQLFVTP